MSRPYDMTLRQKRIDTLAALEHKQKMDAEALAEVKPDVIKVDEVASKVTRQSRKLFIEALKHTCPICQQCWLNSRQWVVREDVTLCKSCWTKMLEFIGYKKMPNRMVIDWVKTCGMSEPVQGCDCRHCVLFRLKDAPDA